MSAPSSTLPIEAAATRTHADSAAMGQAPLVGGFILLLLVAGASIWLFVSGDRANDSVAHTLQVRSDAYRLLTLIQDAETGQRGYLLTNNKDYLRPYEVGSLEAPRALAELQSLVAGNETQIATLSRLRGPLEAKLRELADTIALNERGDSAAAIARVKQNVGKGLMDRIRMEVGQVEAEEERAQNAQRDASRFNNLLLAGSSLAGIVIVILLAAYAIVTSRRATIDIMQARDSLRKTNENLEGLVAERVAELQMANDEIQRFAYIVSHDLRAPLVNVMGFTSELDATRGDIATFLQEVEQEAPHLVTPDRRMAIDTELPEALGFIRTSTAKMDRLINAILKLSREGRRVLTPETIDLRALVKAQGESLSQQLEAGEATLEVREDLPGLVSDRLAIEQIFGNLIENATKYLYPGRPGRIEVSGKTHGSYLRYDVKDNGRGIEAKDFERVFELFRRSGEQDKPGEGIGLAYVRNLARRLGGNVAIQSEFGKGSIFTITLPAVLQTRRE